MKDPAIVAAAEVRDSALESDGLSEEQQQRIKDVFSYPAVQRALGNRLFSESTSSLWWGTLLGVVVARIYVALIW